MYHAFDSSLIDLAHGLTTLVMLEKLGYAAVLFTLATRGFNAREIPTDA